MKGKLVKMYRAFSALYMYANSMIPIEELIEKRESEISESLRRSLR